MNIFNPKDLMDRLKKLDLKKNYIGIIAAILVIGLILARTAGNIQRVLFGRKAPETAELELVGEAIPVKVYKTKEMSFKDTLPAMGTIKGFKEVELKFETSGVLESFNFEEGERIQEGDIIANLNQRDALLKLKYAELELEKARKLFEQLAENHKEHFLNDSARKRLAHLDDYLVEKEGKRK